MHSIPYFILVVGGMLTPRSGLSMKVPKLTTGWPRLSAKQVMVFDSLQAAPRPTQMKLFPLPPPRDH